MAEVHEQVRHPIFARMYVRIAAMAEKTGQLEHREETLAGLTGRVIEVGSGQGLNFAHYPPSVTEVLAVEPEAFLREKAKAAAGRVVIPVTIVDATASRLPADDASFDAGVVSLVLCSVPNQASALAELSRVIRPGGELHFYEHVRSTAPRLARVQRFLDRSGIWPRVGGGCHCGRETEGAIREAGFEVERLRDFDFRPCLLTAPIARHIIGVARRP